MKPENTQKQQLAILDALNRHGILLLCDLEKALHVEHPNLFSENNFSDVLEKLLAQKMVHRIGSPESIGLSSKGIFQLKNNDYDLVSNKEHDDTTSLEALWPSHAFLAIAELLSKKIASESQAKDFTCYPRVMTRRGMAPLFQFTYDQHIKRSDGLVFDGNKHCWIDINHADIDDETLLKDMRSLAHSLLNWQSPNGGPLYVFLTVKDTGLKDFHKRLTNVFLQLKREVQSRHWEKLLKRFLLVSLITDEADLIMGHRVEYLAKNEKLLPKKLRDKKPGLDVTQAMAMMAQAESGAPAMPVTSAAPLTPRVQQAAPAAAPTVFAAPAALPKAAPATPVSSSSSASASASASATGSASATVSDKFNSGNGQSGEKNESPQKKNISSAPSKLGPQALSSAMPAALSSTKVAGSSPFAAQSALAPAQDPLFIDKRSDLGVATIQPRSDDWLLHKIAILLNEFGSLTFKEIVELISIYQPMEQAIAAHLREPNVISTAINELVLMRIAFHFKKEKRLAHNKEEQTKQPLASRQVFSLTEKAAGYLETQGVIFYPYTSEQHWERTRSGDYFYQQQGMNELCHRVLLTAAKTAIAENGDEADPKALTFYPPHRVKRELLTPEILHLKHHLEFYGALEYQDTLFVCLSLSSPNAILKLNQNLKHIVQCFNTYPGKVKLHYFLHVHNDKAAEVHLPWANQQQNIAQRFLRVFEHSTDDFSSDEIDALKTKLGFSLFLLPDATTFDVEAHCYMPSLTTADLAALPPAVAVQAEEKPMLSSVAAAAPAASRPASAEAKAPPASKREPQADPENEQPVVTTSVPAAVPAPSRYQANNSDELSCSEFDFTLTIGAWYYYDFPNFLADTPVDPPLPNTAGIFCPIGIEDDRIVVIGLPSWAMINRFYQSESGWMSVSRWLGYLKPSKWQVPVYHIDFEDIATRTLARIASPWPEGEVVAGEFDKNAGTLANKVLPFQIVEIIRGDAQAKESIVSQQYPERLILPTQARGITIGALQGLGFAWAQGKLFYARLREQGPNHNKKNPTPPFFKRVFQSKSKQKQARKAPTLLV